MQITDEKTMIEFCERVNKDQGIFGVDITGFPSEDYADWWEINHQEIKDGLVGNESHLQQGIKDALYHTGQVIIEETPLLYPPKRILSEKNTLTGTMTGNLSNCYDPNDELFLFHMRGNDISQPFGFQAAAAGMGIYGQNPGLTAALELQQESGLEVFAQFGQGSAIGIHPFMKGGDKGVPQPLLSYGFLADLSRYEVLESHDDVARFEDAIKFGIRSGHTPNKEGFHFAVSLADVDNITTEINRQNRFYGPILESHQRFHEALKREGFLE